MWQVFYMIGDELDYMIGALPRLTYLAYISGVSTLLLELVG